MAIQGSIISFFSAIISVIALVLVFLVFSKVYQGKYKRPWIFIAVSIVVLVFSHIIKFMIGYGIISVRYVELYDLIAYFLDFISILVLTYGVLLEYLILVYYKGKFVKMKFVPVQEGTLGGELDINVTNGGAYLAFKKEKNFLLKQFADATKKGFEGFLLTENNPKDIRVKYNLKKTPIAWITSVDDISQVKRFLDVSSDVVDPLQLNNIIGFVDNFLEQSHNPFLLLDLNLILRKNTHSVVFEFLKYMTSKVVKNNGIFICFMDQDILDKGEFLELQDFLKDLE